MQFPRDFHVLSSLAVHSFEEIALHSVTCHLSQPLQYTSQLLSPIRIERAKSRQNKELAEGSTNSRSCFPKYHGLGIEP